MPACDRAGNSDAAGQSNATAGDNVTFSVVATGTLPAELPMAIQGHQPRCRDGQQPALTNVPPSDAGSYSVLVSNTVGTLLSSNATLTVNPPAPCVPPPAGLVSWWRAEGDAPDFAGSNNGQLLSGVTFAPDRVGQAFSFDGSSGYISHPRVSQPRHRCRRGHDPRVLGQPGECRRPTGAGQSGTTGRNPGLHPALCVVSLRSGAWVHLHQSQIRKAMKAW